MKRTLASLLLAAVTAVAAASPPQAAETLGPMAQTRAILEASNRIVTGKGDHDAKLAALKRLLRDFLDTDALGRRSMGQHLDQVPPEEQRRFLHLFRDLFVRTYVQRLLLFEVPRFAYGKEEIEGDTARVATEIVTDRDRFAVDYRLRRTPEGWRATDILIEGVSLAANFRAQFDRALAKNSFPELLDKLDRKLHGTGPRSL